jgi:hypothetical protein
MQKPGEILEQIQRIANDMQNKVGDAIRNSPAQEIEKNENSLDQTNLKNYVVKLFSSGTICAFIFKVKYFIKK